MSSSVEVTPPYDCLYADPQSQNVQIKECVLAKETTNVVFRGWLGYRRCHDFDVNKGIGQDNAALWYDNDYAVGIICDGVSQSYYGNIAATILTHSLIKHLWEKRSIPPDKSTLRNLLVDIESEIIRATDNFRPPDGLPKMLQEQLEETRTKSGSQCVFSAFIFDINADANSNDQGHLHAYQVGDSFLYAFTRPDRSTNNVTQDWEGTENTTFKETIYRLHSIPRGRVGSIGKNKLDISCGFIKGVEGISVHSDGIPIEWGISLTNLSPFSKEDTIENKKRLTLEKFIESDWSKKDDVSFISILSNEILSQLQSKPLISSPSSQSQPSSSNLKSPIEINQESLIGFIPTKILNPELQNESSPKVKPISHPAQPNEVRIPPPIGPRKPTLKHRTIIVIIALLLISALTLLYFRKTSPHINDQIAVENLDIIDFNKDDSIIKALKSLNEYKNTSLEENIKIYQSNKNRKLIPNGKIDIKTINKMYESLSNRKIKFIKKRSIK